MRHWIADPSTSPYCGKCGWFETAPYESDDLLAGIERHVREANGKESL